MAFCAGGSSNRQHVGAESFEGMQVRAGLGSRRVQKREGKRYAHHILQSICLATKTFLLDGPFQGAAVAVLQQHHTQVGTPQSAAALQTAISRATCLCLLPQVPHNCLTSHHLACTLNWSSRVQLQCMQAWLPAAHHQPDMQACPPSLQFRGLKVPQGLQKALPIPCPD